MSNTIPSGEVSSPVSISSPAELCRDFSIEITARDRSKVAEAATVIPPGTQVSITWLPNEKLEDRIEAAAVLRGHGFKPMPHISARRIDSAATLERFLDGISSKAEARRVFVIAGDPDRPEGPFEDALAIIRSGLLGKYGIERVGIAGYPEGHPKIGNDVLWQTLHDKMKVLGDLGHDSFIMTQFGFDPAPILEWLARLRREGIDIPVRVGVAGPATVKTLLRFAALCGVGASTKVLARYGVSITKVFSEMGPEPIIRDLSAALSPAVHGDVHLHFYPFGGVLKTANWVREFVTANRS